MKEAIKFRLRGIYDRVREVKDIIEINEIDCIEYGLEDEAPVTIGDTLRNIENDLANILLNN